MIYRQVQALFISRVGFKYSFWNYVNFYSDSPKSISDKNNATAVIVIIACDPYLGQFWELFFQKVDEHVELCK